MEQPVVYMLCGVPGSGKSTWLEDNLIELDHISTDAIIEYIGSMFGTGLLGLTYDECFQDLIKFAEKQMYRDLADMLQRDESFVWDQTNLTPKSRKAKLAKIPAHYKKIAVNFKTPAEDELKRRLDSRPGKTIPEEVMKNMIASFVPATVEEGFDEIIDVVN